MYGNEYLTCLYIGIAKEALLFPGSSTTILAGEQKVCRGSVYM